MSVEHLTQMGRVGMTLFTSGAVGVIAGYGIQFTQHLVVFSLVTIDTIKVHTIDSHVNIYLPGAGIECHLQITMFYIIASTSKVMTDDVADALAVAICTAHTSTLREMRDYKR
jgi:hypothetical protein